jgi:hypothetical protein
MPVQVLVIQFLKDIKHLIHERAEAYDVGAFERFKVVYAAIIQLPYMRMRHEFSKPSIDVMQRSYSR